jgi:hypothetical protein
MASGIINFNDRYTLFISIDTIYFLGSDNIFNLYITNNNDIKFIKDINFSQYKDIVIRYKRYGLTFEPSYYLYDYYSDVSYIKANFINSDNEIEDYNNLTTKFCIIEFTRKNIQASDVTSKMERQLKIQKIINNQC